ncbi:hypothetical protein D1227_18555 [Henriciella mobilis]|uniref:phosphatidylserine decarboxylase n=1 Tax=Henriciella mobilis TaxID=2305467 RepID=UPI000E66BDBF|nr:phosphatidylserine decarboxylase [Henriciella mobilis]RIJ15499.1 hypothetical protein D1231_12205 [Henriciella mobilis]RIJ18963.1 hypothetical protein D1227_18555 [Henriciella mobilis]
MAKKSKSVADRTFPWFQSGFDLEGIVGFLAAWLLGILLGMLWGPLFWLAFIPGLVLLFATRTAERVSPDEPGLVIAPCDGVVVSIEEADPPEELRMSEPAMRVRISSSPFSSNNIHAPVEGTIDHLVREEGAAEAFAAMQPDSAGLEVLYFAIEGDSVPVGLRVATGGLGPRLETRADAGDRVTAGKTIGTRRLGGWCDVFVPLEGKILVEPGRTLIGGETALIDLTGVTADGFRPPAPEYEDEEPVADTLPPEVAEAFKGDEDKDDAEPGGSETEAEATGEADDETGTDDLDPDDPRRNDPAEMFARLRRKASSLSDDPDKPKDS